MSESGKISSRSYHFLIERILQLMYSSKLPQTLARVMTRQLSNFTSLPKLNLIWSKETVRQDSGDQFFQNLNLSDRFLAKIIVMLIWHKPQ